MPKRLQSRSSRKRPMEVPTLAPLKALKVSPSSTAHWVVEAQAAIQHESDGVEAPPVVEATEVEAPRASEAEATEVRVPRTTEATAAGAGAPGTTEATVAEADVSAAKPAAQELEMKAVEASVVPLVQGLPPLRESVREAEVHPISSDDTSRAQEVVDAEVVGTVEQLALTPGEGSSALVRSAARTACEALEVEGVQSGSSLESHLIALSGKVRERLRGALHTGVKCTLAVIASHYIGIDLKAISDGYVLPDDDREADKEVAKLMEAAKDPSAALAKLFEGGDPSYAVHRCWRP
ncbi:uncharacterized protein [Miscanthus floridulus]|uniref:uncharacterized protein n=1 Tax=Miscanthus floridulus TaxID=154761 RepID=UPI0034576873